MSITFILLSTVVVVVLLLLAWVFHSSNKSAKSRNFAGALGEAGRSHVEHLPQIRQALGREDEEFLMQAGEHALRRRLKKERRRIALSYLKASRQDFERLLHTATFIAALSPEIGVGQEFERLRLTATFLWKYRAVQLALFAGYAPLPEVASLSNFIGGLSVRLEAAVKAMGERAALAAEMISASDRSRIHLT